MIVYYLWDRAFVQFDAGLRRGDGLRAVRRHPGRSPRCSSASPEGTCTTHDDYDPLHTTAACRTTGRAVRLPFSPWHLVLIPLSFLLIVPLLWMLVTSLETEGEANRFPPVLLPASPAVSELRRRVGRGAVRALLPQQHTGHAGRAGEQPGRLQPRRLRVRPHPIPRPRSTFRHVDGDADGAVPGHDDPGLPDREVVRRQRLGTASASTTSAR